MRYNGDRPKLKKWAAFTPILVSRHQVPKLAQLTEVFLCSLALLCRVSLFRRYLQQRHSDDASALQPQHVLHYPDPRSFRGQVADDARAGIHGRS